MAIIFGLIRWISQTHVVTRIERLEHTGANKENIQYNAK